MLGLWCIILANLPESILRSSLLYGENGGLITFVKKSNGIVTKIWSGFPRIILRRNHMLVLRLSHLFHKVGNQFLEGSPILLLTLILILLLIPMKICMIILEMHCLSLGRLHPTFKIQIVSLWIRNLSSESSGISPVFLASVALPLAMWQQCANNKSGAGLVSVMVMLHVFVKRPKNPESIA